MAKMTCPNCGAEAPADATTCPKCSTKLPQASRVAEGDPLAEGTIISTEGDLSPLVESVQLVVPKRGKLFDEDGVGRFAIIRPCMSRGRRIGTQKLPPIYEPRMLAEHAKVFTGWPMYLDHMEEEFAEELVAALQERGRSVLDLGGRLVESFYDPELTFEDDHEYGYRKGGVVGNVIPQRKVREMLEDDPGCLQCSINAWPTKVSVGSPSWDRSSKGALIEGIRSKPMGSVDFVFRGGAGGRPLSESERHSTVSLLASAYDSDHDAAALKETPSMPQKKLSEMTQEEIAALRPEQLKEVVERDAPHLKEAFEPKKAEPAVTGEGTVTVEQLNEALEKQKTSFEESLSEKLGESGDSAKELAEKMVEERESLRVLADHASTKLSEIERNGLQSDWVAEIRKNYVLLPSGPKAGIVVTEADLKDSEGKELTAEQVIEGRIKADVEQSIRLIESAGGKPRVKGFGATGADRNGSEAEGGNTPTTLRESDDDAFIEFLEESGDLTGDDKKDGAALNSILEEVR